MTKHLVRSMVVALFAVTAVSVAAEDARTLRWDELAAGRMTTAENPFTSLAPDDLSAISTVAAIRARRAGGFPVSDEQVTMEKTALVTLQKDHIDTDGMLAKREELVKRLRESMRAVNPALNGTKIHLAGYVLPLEFSGKQVSEFLLVPWVGACIHTPPPEANQIVYVRPEKPFDMDGMFEAVWVTGRLSTAGSTRSVQIVDGSADVDVGYSLRADAVERYRE